MDPMLRTVKQVKASTIKNIPAYNFAFSFVKHATGKSNNSKDDYTIFEQGDTLTIAGELGTITLELTPLFEII